MMRYALHHCGMDEKGRRHWRMKPVAAARRTTRHAALFPKVSWVVRCVPVREVWRNGLHQRHCLALVEQLRADRRSFLAALPCQALVSPITPFTAVLIEQD